MRENLKPCPLCGAVPELKWRGIGRSRVSEGPEYRLFRYECRNIECPLNPVSHEYRDSRSAAGDWNERIVREAAR